ncbi:MAG: hypothetical protein K9M44_00650 [Candidatus Pacebacteria bacterium]|nr:hypothetical protein [Candidatus Paceibacterota bacterium]
MKKILQKTLRFFSKLILKKYQPKVVGITGSVGKTSTKEAVFQVLSGPFKCRSTYKNFNNEIGLPLTIIGISESPGRNFWGWFLVFLKACKLILIKDNNYPNILILEMGVDRPNDMDYLLSIVKVDIAIVSSVSHSHLEFFKKVEAIAKEKGKLVKSLSKSGSAILNFDNPLSRQFKSLSQAKVFFYGLQIGADLKAVDLNYNFSNFASQEPSLEKISGLNLKLEWQGSLVPLSLKKASNLNAVYAGMAAILTGLRLGLNLMEILSSLSDFSMPPGRLNIISGIKHTYIIDDTYNASPESTLAALDFLSKMKFSNSRKILVMGEMLELGSYTEKGHQLVGEEASKVVDVLIAVGEKARGIIRGAIEAGFDKDKCFYFNDSDSAGRFLQELVELNDIVLVKGSQGSRMEKVVKEIMANPLEAESKLVRQNQSWLH